MRGNTLYIIVPCYNEEEVIYETSERLNKTVRALIDSGKVSSRSRIVFVNDGSTDRTWQIISDLHTENNIFSGINLSRNTGQQSALLAGLMTAKDLCDFTISLDADLQDDIGVLEQFVDEYHNGSEIVYGVRSNRETDAVLKRITARWYYRLLNLLGAQIIYDHADFRLMSRKALEALSEFKEVNVFLRGLIPMIGYKCSTVFYERNERFAGKSKYPLKKLLALAVEGITSLSIRPVRLISLIGLLIFLPGLFLLAYNTVLGMAGRNVNGWTTVAASVWMIGGLQLLAIGIIGEYIGKIYLESKRRPRYIIDEFLND